MSSPVDQRPLELKAHPSQSPLDAVIDAVLVSFVFLNLAAVLFYLVTSSLMVLISVRDKVRRGNGQLSSLRTQPALGASGASGASNASIAER